MNTLWFMNKRRSIEVMGSTCATSLRPILKNSQDKLITSGNDLEWIWISDRARNNRFGI